MLLRRFDMNCSVPMLSCEPCILYVRMSDLQDGSGSEDSDTNLLKDAHISESPSLHTGNENDLRYNLLPSLFCSHLCT